MDVLKNNMVQYGVDYKRDRPNGGVIVLPLLNAEVII